MNPTLDSMRVKVHDVNDGAILTTLVVPSVDDPFLSVAVQWLQRDLPLESTSLIKNRDFVYIEATCILHFANGERVGYHLMHSAHFPQTDPLPKVVRGNISICCMFRQLSQNLIDNHSFSTLEPAGELLRFLMLPIAAERLLSATYCEPCGQMTKLAWVQHRRSERSHSLASSDNVCVTCSKSGTIGPIGRSTCTICCGPLCRPCTVHKRVSMIAPDGKMLQPKVTFCARCASEASRLEVARDVARGYDASKMRHASSFVTASSISHSDQSW